MPTIKEHYEIQGPVPFIDVRVDADNRLYIDPHAIRLGQTGQPFADQALRCLDTFFKQIVDSILEGTPHSLHRGERLLQRFVEPWETRLGMSREGFFGHGGSDTVGSWIWEVLTEDVEALVHVGVLKQIEDLPLFVEGVDRDITSDITTRIIFSALASFTEEMIVRYPQFSEGEHGVEVFTKQVWDSEALEWADAQMTLPVVNGKALLLVPTGWARSTLLMSARRFYDTSVLSFAQLEQAVLGSNGKLIKSPKHVLRKHAELTRGRNTNLVVTMRAFNSGEDLLAAFKAFIRGRLDKDEFPKQLAA